MSTEKTKNRQKILGNGTVWYRTLFFRLWGGMFGLVLFAIILLSVTQIFLFEKQYAQTALNDSQARLTPAMEELRDRDLSEDPFLLSFLSRAMDGTVYLVDGGGELISVYSYGNWLNSHANAPTDAPEYRIWNERLKAPAESHIAGRAAYQNVDRLEHEILLIQQGIPVTYNGSGAYLLIVQEINLSTALSVNRRQLVLLSVVLTLAASLLAAVFSRNFTRPIYAIKNVVDRLSENDFSARPNIDRKDELGQLARSVDRLSQALKRVDGLRKEVIANVSHELRSPLAVIAGYAEMVRDIHWSDEKKRNEDLNLIIQESGRMSAMVSDILDYSQIQSGYLQLKPEPVNLCLLTETELVHSGTAAAKFGIRIDFSERPDEFFVSADPVKMGQVLRNLLSNAINHTPQDQVITVSLKVKDDGTFRLQVENPGDPIPEEERALIWERYQRSQHQSGRRLGTGIGLSIVSTILNAHGMKYGVDCEGGKTIFWFAGSGLEAG